MRRAVSLFALMAVLFAALPARAYRLEVLVSDRVSMQYATFWIALEGGYFADEGYEVVPVLPADPRDMRASWDQHVAELGVLPASAMTSILASHGDISIVANLVMNDPVNLVVRRSVVDRTHLRLDAPVHDRLDALRTMGVGVAPETNARFHMAYDAFGLSADRDARIVPLPAPESCAAFHDGKIDALYTGSPCLEHAIVADDAVLVVSQSAGEVPPAEKHVVVAFAVHQQMIDTQRPAVVSLVRALLRAGKLVHRAPEEASAILARRFPGRDRRELDTIVQIYTPSILVTPDFPFQELPRTATVYFDGPGTADFSRVDLRRAVSYDVMASAQEKIDPRHQRHVMLAAAAILLLTIAVGWFTRRSPASARRYRGPTSTSETSR